MKLDLSMYRDKIVQHFKGDYYIVLDVAEHTETGEQFVIYRALYGDNKLYARPATMFVQLVDKEKYPDSPFMYRFTPTRLSSAKEIYEARLAQQRLQQQEETETETEYSEDKNLQ